MTRPDQEPDLTESNAPRSGLDEIYGHRTTQSLHDFLAHGEYAGQIVARGRAAYDDDVTLRLAAEAVVLRLGESVARLSAEFKQDHRQVPWSAIEGTRNRVAHGYQATDHRILWTALERDVPAHAEEVRRILDDR